MPTTINGTSGITTSSVSGTSVDATTVTQGGVAMPRMVLATAQPTTSGTSVDFTGIPSWVKRITVMFNGVSTNGTSSLQIQLGSGSVTTTGYVSSANSTVTSTTGLLASSNMAAANTYQGGITIAYLGSYARSAFVVTSRNDAATFWCAGSVTLSGILDRVRITTVNGTDTFDAGSVNILYEG